MNAKKSNANESAYPCPVGHIECAHPTGLTKRELVAAMCLQGLLANPAVINGSVDMSNAAWSAEVVAESVIKADALIAELSKEQKP